MRMVVSTESFLPNMGGLERNTFTLATALAALGHEVTVLTATLETAGPEEAAFPFKVVRGMGLGNCFSAIRGGDLIFVNAGISLKACLVAYFFGKKYVPIYAHHGLFVVDDPGFLGKIRRGLRKFLAQKAAASILLSRFAKDRLERLLPDGRALVLPNPIDGELEKAAAGLAGRPSEKVFDLFFAGRLVRGKGIFVLVDALKLLRPGLPLNVAIAGEGPESGEFYDHAAGQGIPLENLGRIDGQRLIGAYLKSRAVVVPSTAGEGSPLVIAEAISLGVPVIASDQGPMVEAVGGAGLVFRNGDAADLAEKIAFLFQKDHLAEITAQTAQRKQGFSSEQYLTNLQGILKELVHA